VSHDAGGATPGLAAASQSASGLSRFTLSTHSPSTESPFHSHASKLSSPSAMGVSGVSHINSPSLSRLNAQRSTEQYDMKCIHSCALYGVFELRFVLRRHRNYRCIIIILNGSGDDIIVLFLH